MVVGIRLDLRTNTITRNHTQSYIGRGGEGVRVRVSVSVSVRVRIRMRVRVRIRMRVKEYTRALHSVRLLPCPPLPVPYRMVAICCLVELRSISLSVRTRPSRSVEIGELLAIDSNVALAFLTDS